LHKNQRRLGEGQAAFLMKRKKTSIIPTMKTQLSVIAAAVLAVVSLSSCQSTSASIGESAVMCDKCKTVWVRTAATPNITGRTATVFRDHQIMQCPDCEKAYATFVRTGSLKHHCSHCGGTLSHCTTH
jgi:hypothetical protein